MNMVTKYTNSNGNITNYTYDKRMQLVNISSPLGGGISYTYDGNGNLTKELETSGRIRTYDYDLNDRLVKATTGGSKDDKSVNEDKREMHYEYDSVGNMTSKTDGNGNTTKYKYNLIGQMTEETNPLGNKTTFIYDTTCSSFRQKQICFNLKSSLKGYLQT